MTGRVRRGALPCGLALLALLAAPARAELRVRLSRTVTGRYESVGITVTDPLSPETPGADPVRVLLDGPGGSRRGFTLLPTGRKGEWSGRFTPEVAGVYGGTVLLEGERQKDLGFLPTLKVVERGHPGLVRLHPSSQRLLALSGGGRLFPAGVRLEPSDTGAGTQWRDLIATLVSHGLNYVEVPVAWRPARSEQEREAERRGVDALLLAAEQSRKVWVQIRLDGPAAPGSVEPALLARELASCVRRWSYSPALAAWNVAAADPALPAGTRNLLVRAVRGADALEHLVAAPAGRFGELPAGVDLATGPSNWQRPDLRRSILYDDDSLRDASPLPGEDHWQMLVLGGIGLPLAPYSPRDQQGPAALKSLGERARLAQTVPYHEPPVIMTGVIAIDTPGSFCRYGNTLLGWAAGLEAGPFEVPSLPKGHYRFRLWDAETNRVLTDQSIFSDGAGAKAKLPAGVPAVFLMVSPTPGPG